MPIKLVPMTQEEYAAYVDGAAAEYAAEHVRAGNWTPEEAPERGRGEFDQLLPQGPSTPDQFLWTIVDADGGQTVGMIWLALQRSGTALKSWVYDFKIAEEHRRRGYGSQALAAAEREMAALGASQVGLHVFAHNAPARALYERAGYQATNIVMAKELKPE